MRALGIVVQIGITLFAVAFTMNVIEGWSELAGFQTFMLGMASGMALSGAVVYGILRPRFKKKKTKKARLSGMYSHSNR